MFRRLMFFLIPAAALMPAAGAHAQATGAVRLLSHYIPPLGGSYVAGCWGWTDTVSGREYALLGSSCGTSIVEVTNPLAPVERDFVPGVCSIWREIQVHAHYAYVVSEGGGGVQIIDLSSLPDSAHLVKGFNYTSGVNNTLRSHTLHIRDGYMYLNGCANWSPGGLLIFSLADPENPSFVSAYESRYYHDCFVRNDTLYAATLTNGIEIVSLANKLSPAHIADITYPGQGTHNMATTADGRFLLTTDEIGSTQKTVKIWDLRNPPSYPKVAEYTGNPAAIVHNVFVKGSNAYLSHYTAGFRAFSISDPENPVEIGGYDTFAGADGSYDGAWSTYPFFPSGTIIIGDMSTGLYVVDLDANAPHAPAPFGAYSDYLTPASIQLTWGDPTTSVTGGPLAGLKLHLYRNGNFLAEVDSGVGAYTDTGLALHEFVSYTLTAVVPGDSSTFAAASAYAGGSAQPGGVSAFSARDASDGVALSWQNPARQTDNTPLNDLGAVLVYRDGMLAATLNQAPGDTGAARSYTDTVTGYHSYRLVVADTEIPTHDSPPSDSLLAFGAILNGWSEGFEAGRGQVFATGTWDTTGALGDGSGHSLTDSPGGNYAAGGPSSSFLAPAVKIGPGWMLRFRHIAIIPGDGLGLVEISTNHRTTFQVLKGVYASLHPEWMDGVAGPADWFTETLDLSAYAGDTAVVLFNLRPGSTLAADGWYVDNMFIGPASADAAETTQVADGWNLLSLPGIVADPAAASVYPASISPAFGYDGTYAEDDTLRPLAGYWLKFESPASVPMTVAAIRRDTLDLGPRWNLIGALTDVVPAGGIKTLPAGILASGFFAYDSGAYAQVTSLAPGRGYWVKASAPGKLVLSAFTGGAAAAAAPAKRDTTGMMTLVFRDGGGNTRLLTLARAAHAADLAGSELPPLPPPGAFDIRFATGRSMATSGEGRETAIVLQGVRYPLDVTWRSASGGAPAGASLAVDERRIALAGAGSARIEGPAAALAVVFSPAGGGATPSAYALDQNFPNPFNPVTTIRYRLAGAGRVRLAVYDMLGREVRRLVDEDQPAGDRTVVFDAAGLASGMYVARLQAGLFTGIRKMTVMK